MKLFSKKEPLVLTILGATLHMKEQGASMCGYRSLSLYATDHEEGGVADEVHGEALDELDQLGPS